MTTPDAAAPPIGSDSRPTRARALSILGLLMLVSGSHLFHRVGLSAVGDQVASRWTLTAIELGLIHTAFLVTYTLLMVPGGWLADRVGTWRTLLLVAAGTGVFGALSGAADWLDLEAGGAAIWTVTVMGAMGVCAAPLFPSTSRTVAAWFSPARQVWANAFVTAAALLGVAASAKVLSELGIRMGWSGALALTGSATLLVAALWAALGRESPAPRPRSSPHPREPLAWGRFLTHRGIIALTLGYAAVGYFEYVFFYWLKYYYREILQLDEVRSANYTMLPYLSMAVATPLGGVACSLLARRRGLRRALPLCAMAFMGLAAASLAGGVLLRSSDPSGSVVWFMLACSFIGMSEGPFWTTAVRLGGKHGATAGGVVNTGGNLGGLIAPALTPVIASGSGWDAALLATGGVAVLGLFSWLAVDPDDPYREES